MKRRHRVTLSLPTPMASRYRRKTQGKTSGLGICEYWAILFDSNERLQASKKMTDDQMLKLVAKEFPASTAVARMIAGQVPVNQYRSYYNAGRLTGGKVPERLSHRYAADGSIIQPPKRKSKVVSGTKDR